MKRKTPIKISKILERIDHTLSGKWLKACSFFPNRFPVLKKISWKAEINKGKRKGWTPRILPQLPIQKQSKERAKPRNRASLPSIEFEKSKSKFISFFRIAWWKTKMPIAIKIIFPINLVTKSGKIVLIIFPNHTDKTEMVKEITNKTIFARIEILVFLMPYVMPIPRESILLESDKTSELINIKTPP